MFGLLLDAMFGDVRSQVCPREIAIEYIFLSRGKYEVGDHNHISLQAVQNDVVKSKFTSNKDPAYSGPKPGIQLSLTSSVLYHYDLI